MGPVFQTNRLDFQQDLWCYNNGEIHNSVDDCLTLLPDFLPMSNNQCVSSLQLQLQCCFCICTGLFMFGPNVWICYLIHFVHPSFTSSRVCLHLLLTIFIWKLIPNEAMAEAIWRKLSGRYICPMVASFVVCVCYLFSSAAPLSVSLFGWGSPLLVTGWGVNISRSGMTSALRSTLTLNSKGVFSPPDFCWNQLEKETKLFANTPPTWFPGVQAFAWNCIFCSFVTTERRRNNNFRPFCKPSLRFHCLIFLLSQLTPLVYLCRLNQHWKPFYMKCNPCFIQYDAIIRLETIGSEAPFLLKKIAGNKNKPPNKNTQILQISAFYVIWIEWGCCCSVPIPHKNLFKNDIGTVKKIFSIFHVFYQCFHSREDQWSSSSRVSSPTPRPLLPAVEGWVQHKQ